MYTLTFYNGNFRPQTKLNSSCNNTFFETVRINFYWLLLLLNNRLKIILHEITVMSNSLSLLTILEYSAGDFGKKILSNVNAAGPFAYSA